MTATPIYFHNIQRGVVYDGTNGADLVTYNNSLGPSSGAGTATLVSESGGEAYITFVGLDGDPTTGADTIHVGDVFTGGRGTIPAAVFAANYRVDEV